MDKKDKKVEILQDGAKVLRQKAEDIALGEIKSIKIKELLKKMNKVIAETDIAIAVAAPQVGEAVRVFAISKWAANPRTEIPKEKFENIVFINPKILKLSKEKSDSPESCLSAPEFFGFVKRAEKVKVEAYDENGKKFTLGASGLMAQAIQHESDHLDGTLFIDKAHKLQRLDKEEEK